MATNEKHAIHLLAGGIGGTVGAVITCPLEVVKTRLQSSIYTQIHPAFLTNNAATCLTGTTCNVGIHTCSSVALSGELPASTALYNARSRSLGLYYCLRHIVETEGPNGLFKGLGPNLVGVAPSRAIYFFSYANMKKYLNTVMYAESPLVHILSAMSAGFASCTATNPIWFIKTRMQLDQKRKNSITVRQCIKQIHSTSGIRGFYKGITASYFGITETVIHFVLYEAFKARLLQYSQNDWTDFLRYMVAGASSKTVATCIAYPHEVARTRLREEGNKYRSFIQTLLLVAKEEGYRGLYRGITTQLVRQIPNTAIMMSTYELVVYLCDGNT